MPAFKKNNPGCTCCDCDPATTKITFNVKGCASVALPGASVSLTGPASITGTTDSSGVFVAGILTPGTYNWSISATKYQTQTGTSIVGACGSAITVNATLVPTSSYLCCNQYLYTPTLHLTTSAGTVALVFVSGSGWIGDINVSLNAYSPRSCFGPPAECYAAWEVAPSVQSVPVRFFIQIGFCFNMTQNWDMIQQAWKTLCTDSPPGTPVGTPWPAPSGCLPLVGCPGGPFFGTSERIGWTAGPLPQTITFPSTLTGNAGCSLPLSGSMVLSE